MAQDNEGKAGTILTAARLTRLYDSHCHKVFVSTGHCESLPRGKGQQQRYKVLKDLPAVTHYQTLRDTKYTHELGSLVSDAFSEAESLKDEIQDWYDSLPGQFQEGDKGDQLQEVISTLDDASEPSVPACLEKIPVVFLPPTKITSRADRMGSAVGQLQAVLEKLDEITEVLQALPIPSEEEVDKLSEADDLRTEIDEAISTFESVEFPGMMS